MAFDASKFPAGDQPVRDDVIIPARTKVRVRVVSAVEKTSAAGNVYTDLRFVVVDGAFRDASFYDNHTHTGVGGALLAALCRLAGMAQGYSSPSQLIGARVDVVVKVEPASGQYAARNRVGHYVEAPNADSEVPF